MFQREQINLTNLIHVTYDSVDKLSIYKRTEPKNIKGRFPGVNLIKVLEV